MRKWCECLAATEKTYWGSALCGCKPIQTVERHQAHHGSGDGEGIAHWAKGTSSLIASLVSTKTYDTGVQPVTSGVGLDGILNLCLERPVKAIIASSTATQEEGLTAFWQLARIIDAICLTGLNQESFSMVGA